MLFLRLVTTEDLKATCAALVLDVAVAVPCAHELARRIGPNEYTDRVRRRTSDMTMERALAIFDQAVLD